MKQLSFLTVFFSFLAILTSPNTTIAQTNAQANSLTLYEAELKALENDPMLASFAERRRAMLAIAIADGQLPDPMFKIGAVNLPIDSFNLNQEPMTQLQFGVSQRFPRGNTLSLRGDRAASRADIESQKQNLRLRETLLEVRTAWLSAYYWQNAKLVLKEQQKAMEQLVAVTQLHYGGAKLQQQDVLRSELELNLLKDKIINSQHQYESSLAALQKWVGNDVLVSSVAATTPSFSEPMAMSQIRDMLTKHPVIGIRDAEINVQKTDVGLAKQAYKPEWGFDLNYGARASDALGNERADFVSLMVRVDVPLFTGKRQDKRLSAAKHQEAAARFEREEKLRQLSQMLEDTWSNWQRSAERLGLYSHEITSQSAETFEVTLNAYRNQTASFALLINARLLDFDTKLQVLDLTTEHLKAQARLLYLQGEEK